MPRSAAVLLAVICTVLPFAGQFYGDRAGGWLMIDFRAYYCASLAQREGLNPYFTASIHECESHTPAPYYRAPKNVTVPAPYPPYALAFFYPLTFIPFAAAAILWWILLAVALALSAYALARVATWHPEPVEGRFLVAWAVLVLSLGLASFTSGNLMPIGLAAIVLAALAAQRGALGAAVLALALAMIEPQIALPAAAAFFVAFPPIRVALAFVMILLGEVSIASSGVAQTIAYVTAVLPAHALSEVSRDNQYSLSTVMTALGVPDASAALAGSISYAIVGIAGVLVALRLARRYHDPALTLLVPPAFSLLGGSFVHTGEIAAAVPASLVLYTHAQKYRGSLLAALILLAVPWMLATSAAMFLAPLFPVAYVTYTLRRSERAALGAALASGAAIVGLFALYLMPAAHAPSHVHVYPHDRPAPRRGELASLRAAQRDEPAGYVALAPAHLGRTDNLRRLCSAARRSQGCPEQTRVFAISPTHQRRVPESRWTWSS